MKLDAKIIITISANIVAFGIVAWDHICENKQKYKPWVVRMEQHIGAACDYIFETIVGTTIGFVILVAIIAAAKGFWQSLVSLWNSV